MMAGMRLTKCFGLVASLLLTYATADDLECTNGRLFIADEDQPVVHVLDLDNIVNGMYEEVATLPVDKTGLGVMATETELATVMLRDRSDTTTEGKISFMRPGLEAVGLPHHDYAGHVQKTTPASLPYSVTGWRPTHVESSEGFIAVFMDGAPPTHSSSAVFVKESEVVASTQSTPTEIEVPVEGAHHGVALALDEDRFLLTVTTEGDILPDNFIVADETGAVTHRLGSTENPLCLDYHGAAHVGHDMLFGCSDVGLLSVSYDHASKTPSWKLVPFPQPVVGDKTFRSGTVRGHESGGIFAADLREVVPYGQPVPPPFFVVPVATGASTVSADHLVEANRSATEMTHCTFTLDRGLHDEGVMLLVLHSDGYLQVVPVSSAGTTAAPGSTKYVKINETIDCDIAQVVTGHKVAYILIGGGAQTRGIYTVDLEEVAEGHMDHAVTHMPLSFAPGGAALALPPGLACSHSHSSTTTTTEAPVSGAVVPAPAFVLVLLNVAMMLLWALKAAPL